jgi:homospermidine synthase
MTNITKLLFVGFGAVGTAILEVFNLENKFREMDLIVVEPRDLRENLRMSVLVGRKLKWIRDAITRKNYKSLLTSEYLDEHTLMINVSVDVDSIMLIKLCEARGALYLDSSLENYEEGSAFDVHETDYNKFKFNTLYYREILLEKETKHAKRTIVSSFGFNPGSCELYAKKGLKAYARKYNKKALIGWGGNYAKLGHDLGLNSIRISEVDTQKSKKIKSTPERFVNTWSAVGFECELLDNVMVSLSNKDIASYEKDGVVLIKPTEKKMKTNVRFIPEYAVDAMAKGKTLDHDGNVIHYEGMIVPHMEITTLEFTFRYGNDAPTIYYCYKPCEEAERAIEFVKEKGYKPLKDDYVLYLNDIEAGGFDSIGMLLGFNNGDEFWAGSVLSVEDVKKMGFKLSNPTTVQVAGGMYSVIEWMLKNQNRGYLIPEQIPHVEIFKRSSKYMGNEFFKKINNVKVIQNNGIWSLQSSV